MFVLLIASLAIIQPHPTQTDTVQFTNPVIISSDLAQVSHADPHLSINPDNSSELLVGTVVLPDSSKHRIDVLRSTNQGKT